MRTRHDPADLRAREHSPAPPQPPRTVAERVLALQRTVGNASLTQVLGGARLQRLRKEDEEAHITMNLAIEDLEHYRSLLLGTQANWNEYHYQEYLPLRMEAEVDPHITKLKALRDAVVAEDEPAAKIKEAPAVIKQALDALNALNSEGQEADQKAVTAAYGKGHEERKARRAKELSTRKASMAREALEQKAQAAEQATQQTIAATNIVPNPDATKAAFTRQSHARRDALHTWITLSWKPFRNLPREALNNPNCFVYHLSLAQLTELLGRLGDEIVSEFDYQGWPGTRAPLVATAPGLVMPVKLYSMSATIGAEVFVDWVRYNAGHTGPAANLSNSFAFTADRTKFEDFGGTVTDDLTTGHRVYRYNTGRRLVVNAARDAVITYYNGHN